MKNKTLLDLCLELCLLDGEKNGFPKTKKLFFQKIADCYNERSELKITSSIVYSRFYSCGYLKKAS